MFFLKLSNNPAYFILSRWVGAWNNCSICRKFMQQHPVLNLKIRKFLFGSSGTFSCQNIDSCLCWLSCLQISLLLIENNKNCNWWNDNESMLIIGPALTQTFRTLPCQMRGRSWLMSPRITTAFLVPKRFVTTYQNASFI